MFRAIYNFFIGLFKSGINDSQRHHEEKTLPEIRFASLAVRTDKISNCDIGQSDFFCQLHNNKYKWVMFRCPCQCGDVITISLQSVHKPFWKLSLSQHKRPTLYPSVWRDKGCFSHFWVKDGRVFWCVDTGNDPKYRKICSEQI